MAILSSWFRDVLCLFNLILKTLFICFSVFDLIRLFKLCVMREFIWVNFLNSLNLLIWVTKSSA